MRVRDNICAPTNVSVASREKQHIARDRMRLLAESADGLLDRVERVRSCSSADNVAAGLERGAMSQWVVDLTYHIVTCAYVGIAQIRDTAQGPEPLAEAGRTAVDRREWWAHVQHTLFAERGEAECGKQVSDTWRTEAPLIVRLPPSRATASSHARHGRTACAVPIRVDGGLSAIFAVELKGSSPVLPAEAISLTRAMARLAAATLEAAPHRQTRKAQESEALRSALDEMDGALSLVSHELKSPLTAIMLSLHLIKPRVERLMDLQPESPGVGKTLASIRSLLALASRCAEIEDRIATDLVDAARIRSAKMTLSPTLCDLALIVQESVAAQRVAAQTRIIYLEMPDRSVPVSVDPDRVAQVITNFLGNALKYSPKDSPVEVWVEVLKSHARVSVRDRGPGLEKSELTRVWRRFYRVSNVPMHAATGSGLGLGLYIGREIIRQHGGNVGVRSVPGRGATFWFTIPLADAV